MVTFEWIYLWTVKKYDFAILALKLKINKLTILKLTTKISNTIFFKFMKSKGSASNSSQNGDFEDEKQKGSPKNKFGINEKSLLLDNYWKNSPHVPDSEYYSHGD